jgi:predicted aspartyl protease
MIGLVMAASLANTPFLRYDVDVREFGLRGTGTIVVDRLRGRYARRFNVGPASDSEGYDGSIVWTADAAGSSYVQGNADTRSRGLQWARVLRTFGSSSADSQIRIRVGADTETTRFGDIRCIENHFCVPFDISIRDQQGERRIRVRSVEALAGANAAAFEPPALPNDARVDRASGVTSVPFSSETLRGRNIPYVVLPVRINGGAPLRFLLDTGGQNILSAHAARQLGIAAEGNAQVGGAGSGTMRFSFALVDGVRIGDAVMRRQPFMILSFDDLLPDIDGIVGAEMLSRFAARLDFKSGILELARTAPLAWSRGATVSPIAFDKNTPDIAGLVDGFDGRFTLDTGSDGSLDINAPFAAKNRLYTRYNAKQNGKLGGVGGTVQTARVTLKSLTIGNSTLTNVAATLAYPAAGSVSDDPTVAGNIGESVLRRWNVMVFDYRALTITLL